MDEHQTTRVNAAMLPSYQGKNVCLMGMAKDVDTNGTSFTLTTSDGKDVRIQMQEPSPMASYNQANGDGVVTQQMVLDDMLCFGKERHPTRKKKHYWLEESI
ncbi:hypothetical protein MAR_007282 [Mya arenaria]|uniref:Uncharacterized protein n=1 Tax=Mya arenaria TaxID=6604 RepID=A0ABY7DCN7_MYAAR|nr:hypothetical protein MAR_007282 [Mya arenaria]